jgi:hypothetical protein
MWDMSRSTHGGRVTTSVIMSRSWRTVMNKHIHQAAVAIGTAAVGTIFVAGPALASQPVPNGGGANTVGTSSQAARVRSELQDLSAPGLRGQGPAAAAMPRRQPTGSPVELPYLQVGLGLGSIAVVAVTAADLQRRRHHHAHAV